MDKRTYSIDYLESVNELSHKNDIWEILKECDSEFVPPLSRRKSPFDKILVNDVVGKNSLKFYYDEMIAQHFIVITDIVNKELVAFMSFKTNFSVDSLEEHTPANYITTICVTGYHREKGLADRLYAFIEGELPCEIFANNIMTRTWSTNFGHINILKQRNFKCVKTIKNDRGNGIDTDYFCKVV